MPMGVYYYGRTLQNFNKKTGPLHPRNQFDSNTNPISLTYITHIKMTLDKMLLDYTFH